MSALLATQRNGTSMIASYREMPWHGQGTVFPNKVSGQEMLKAAGLDYEVLPCSIVGNVRCEEPITRILKPETIQMPVEGVRGIYRTDTGAILGLSSEKYEIFQNREMVDVMDAIAKDGGITYEVAGGLGRGERVWVLASIPDLSFNVKGDQINEYLTIFTSHDGSSALNIFPTRVRVVCANTWRAATVERQRREKEGGKNTVKVGYSIKHTREMRKMVEQVVEAYAAAVAANKFSREFYNSLAETPSTPAMKEEFFSFVVDAGKDEKDKAEEISKRTAARRENKMAELNALMLSPTNQTPAARGTAWGLWNTASEWIDHLAPTRKVGGKTEAAARFESSQFGGGADLKDAAMGKIAELAGV
jgi:phage/plasmid-like protein (TIGR03299 family)